MSMNTEILSPNRHNYAQAEGYYCLCKHVLYVRIRIFSRSFKMSSTTSIHHFLFSSFLSFPLSKFKSPAISSLSTVRFTAKPVRATCTTTTSNHDSGKDRCASYDRRLGLIFMATLPFILPLHEYMGGLDAKATESQTSEYDLIKEEISKVLTKTKAAGVLRLVFHDAGTFKMDDSSGGMNGSIVYEVDRPENTGLKKPLKILAKAKDEVDQVRPVSWADMIAVGGAEAVSSCGGPVIPVQLGRVDSMVADPEGRLPEETLDARGLKQCFLRLGLSTQELIALSGAHTIGTKGFGSPVVFDNAYYKILLAKPWTTPGGMTSMLGLPSDRALVDDDECLRWITKYAIDQDTFFEDFKNAYIKLVNLGASWRKL